MSWVLEGSGIATCMKDYISMHAPVVDLLTKEDLALAVHYLNPTLSEAELKNIYKKGKTDKLAKVGGESGHTRVFEK